MLTISIGGETVGARRVERLERCPVCSESGEHLYTRITLVCEVAPPTAGGGQEEGETHGRL
jgi:hypothetical protein